MDFLHLHLFHFFISIQEFYSFDEKVVKYMYRPLASENSPYGTNDLMEVHDFNTGMLGKIERHSRVLLQ